MTLVMAYSCEISILVFLWIAQMATLYSRKLGTHQNNSLIILIMCLTNAILLPHQFQNLNTLDTEL